MRPADNGDTAVATISIICNERGCSLSCKDQGSRRQIPVMVARGISRCHRHCHHRCFCRRRRSLLFARWLSRRCLHLSSSRLCLRFSMPIEAPLPLVLWRLSSHLPLVRRLIVTSPVVVRLRLVSPFVVQPPHGSILDPPSLFLPAGCRVTNICTNSASRVTHRCLTTGCVVVVDFNVRQSCHHPHIPSRHCHRHRLCCL